MIFSLLCAILALKHDNPHERIIMASYDNVPRDPVMLLSFLNTQLRDNFTSLEELCGAFDLDINEIQKKMRSINYEYNRASNQFI